MWNKAKNSQNIILENDNKKNKKTNKEQVFLVQVFLFQN